MALLRFVLLMTVSSCLLLSTQNGASAKHLHRKVNYCQIDKFFDCVLYPLMRFTHQTNGTGIPRTDEEFEELCNIFHDQQPYCQKKFTQRCGSPMWQEAVNSVYAKRLQEGYDTFCDKTRPERAAFIKHAPCLIEKVKLSKVYREKCVRSFQANFEKVHEVSFENREKPHNVARFLKAICCAYNHWENCIVGELRDNCGQQSVDDLSAGDVFPFLISYSSVTVTKQLCPMSRYNPADPNSECVADDFLAAKDVIPKGFKSRSYPSYFFSLSCPNVGYGIDNSNDV